MYLAKDLVSGTWQNILGNTASWVSNQNPEMRGFTLYIDGYDDSINNGRSVLHEGKYYYEWGYVFKDTDLDGIFEINSSLENILDGKQPGEFVYENGIYYKEKEGIKEEVDFSTYRINTFMEDYLSIK